MYTITEDKTQTQYDTANIPAMLVFIIFLSIVQTAVMERAYVWFVQPFVAGPSIPFGAWGGIVVAAKYMLDGAFSNTGIKATGWMRIVVSFTNPLFIIVIMYLLHFLVVYPR